MIATSNVTRTQGTFDVCFDYSQLLDEEALIIDNPLIMILKVLNSFDLATIALAGFDGYIKDVITNYVDASMEYTISKERAEEINEDVRQSSARLNLKQELLFVTTSLYQEDDK